jgi:hypothetical protein
MATRSENVQNYLGKSDWKAAIREMEKMFAIDQDPIIRVWIGDAYQKMYRTPDAVQEYIKVADLYVAMRVIVKPLAQYKLALRIEPGTNTHQHSGGQAQRSHVPASSHP